ncbi:MULTISPECIES: ROK family transcriptional regulator [Lysinibacillus]|uniref:ROK family transcriptional regulator n=1 Tax=Lysinibacillus TaxID=400634 RepID=UPI001C8C4B14|nr:MULTISPECIES: ROK family transcriptional regulator [Lysinibacillus]WHP40099.1 ROK family transcriptional regulator [Lysinibacillus boronitolerans]MBX8942533.1 ROK family transcriptional regulator [Lysinibacillus sp. K60]UNT55154.1 ROK family transcriptional regulator [Lysinibacillus capsici]UUV24972.1 ROK family transcriptional regulator [Lysinibacillus sp. FN11]UYB47842.1 ROK family transcriptional regulator [Lysinibacillus capsici]
MKKQDQVQMRRQNKYIVLDAIRQMAPISRIQLSKYTKMSPTTITRIVQELEAEGFILEGVSEETAIGRRPTLIHMREDALYTIGIEIDCFTIRIGILDFLGKLIAFQEVKCSIRHQYEEALHLLKQSIDNIMTEYQIASDKLLGIGIGVPGVINNEEGIIVSSEQLKWENCHIREDLNGIFGCEVIVDNELKMQIIAEIGDIYTPLYSNCILVGIGTGIGASILLNGEVYRGIQNKAGEISHITINPFGEMCHCGKRGCLSMYVSEVTLLKRTPKNLNIQSIEEILHCVDQGEQWAIDIQHDVATFLAIAINNLVCLYEPEAVIVSGEIIEHNVTFQKLLSDKCKQYIWKELQPYFDLQFSNQLKEGVVKGAALQAQKQLLSV